MPRRIATPVNVTPEGSWIPLPEAVLAIRRGSDPCRASFASHGTRTVTILRGTAKFDLPMTDERRNQFTTAQWILHLVRYL